MIFLAFCACQLVAGRGEMLVRAGSEAEKVQLTAGKETAFVSWRVLRQSLQAKLHPLPSGRAILELAGVRFEIAHGLPFTRVNDAVIPLAAAPRLLGDSASVPLQLVAQLLPRLSQNVSYNAGTRTLTLSTVSAAVAAHTTAGASGRGQGATAGAAPAAVRNVAAPPPARMRVIIDAGHGGPDEGTSVVTRSGTRITEKGITLPVATLLGAELKRRNFEVVFTRTRDTLVALQDRGRIANANSGTVFISIHVNSVGNVRNQAARGVETYFLSVARTEDARRLQALENSSVRFEQSAAASPQRDPLSFILKDMRQNDHLRESSTLAEQIQKSVAAMHPGGDRGVKQAEFAVLVGSFMPSVLVEIGFLSNESDAAFLSKQENQKKIALAIATALDGYSKGYTQRVLANGAGR